MLAWRRLRSYGVLRKASSGRGRGGLDGIGWRGSVYVMKDWSLSCCHGGEHVRAGLRGHRDRDRVWPVTAGRGTG